MRKAVLHFMRKICVFVFLLAFLSFLSAVPTFAAGSGGGGGGMSSGGAMPSGRSIDPAKSYQEGVKALKAGDYEKAIRHFKDVLQVSPRETNTNYLLGLSYIGADEPKKARRPLETAVKDDTAPPDAHLQLGLIYLKLDERDKAIERHEALAQLIAKCEAGCTDDRRAKLQTASDSLKAALDGAAAGKPTGWNFQGAPEGRAHFAAAVGLINHRRYEEALIVLERSAAAIGPHPDILNYMGFANRKLGHYDLAMDYYRQALTLNPDHVGATEYLGELYLELGRRDEARAQLARLDQLCPYGCAAREELARWIAAAPQ
jgi:tetratricopeptide (TPR) repeat protein